jgi:lipoyl-dependent peroxiredoxin
MQVVYTPSATATGDARNGHVRSVDGVIDTDLAVPKEMGGPGGALPNPEELFAAGYAACFHSAVKSVAIEAEVPGVHEATARKLTDATHQVCPYSNATRGNVDVTLTVA